MHLYPWASLVIYDFVFLNYLRSYPPEAFSRKKPFPLSTIKPKFFKLKYSYLNVRFVLIYMNMS